NGRCSRLSLFSNVEWRYTPLGAYNFICYNRFCQYWNRCACTTFSTFCRRPHWVLFIVALRRGHDWGGWMIKFYNWFMDLCNPDKKILTPQKTREKMFYKTGNQKPFEKHSIITQQRIDEILDKINQKGFHLLSEEEKNILKRAGEDDF